MIQPPDPSRIAQLSAAGKIDALCDHFERDWKAGRHPRIEDYLASCDVANQGAVLQALLEVEFELVHSAGKQPDAKSYLLRFPQHEQVVHAVLTQAAAASSVQPAEATATRLTPDVATSRVSKVESAPPSSAPKAIDRIGRFEVLQALGEGAFGTVYRARDPKLDRVVAIKLPRNEVLAIDDDRARFLREVRVAATLSPPHLCPVHEAGEIEGRPYIVMALVEGKSLAELIKSGKPQQPTRSAAKRSNAAGMANGSPNPRPWSCLPRWSTSFGRLAKNKPRRAFRPVGNRSMSLLPRNMIQPCKPVSES